MRLDSRSGVRGVLINAETGQRIRWVRWADIPDDPRQQGEYEAFRADPEEARARGVPLASLVYRAHARLRFLPAAPRYGIRPTIPRDLAGSLEEARRRVDARLLVLGLECDEPGCHRQAEYRVSDEQEIEPHRDGDGQQYERAVSTRVRCYCARHYRLPTFTTTRGVQDEVEVGGARPQ